MDATVGYPGLQDEVTYSLAASWLPGRANLTYPIGRREVSVGLARLQPERGLYGFVEDPVGSH